MRDLTAGRGHLTGPECLPADPVDTVPPEPRDAPSGRLEASGGSGRAQAMSSDEAASRYIRVTWHETWQRLVLLAGSATLAGAIMVLVTFSDLPIQTAARITIFSLASCGGGVGLSTVIWRRRQAVYQDSRDDPSP